MRLIFAGTPPFAAAALDALADAGHEVVCVLTQPDRPSGRGMKLQPGAVKQVALARGLPVAQPVTLRDADTQAMLAALAPEVMVVAAYGLILPPPVLAVPPRGCLNIHASLLPRWRGAAPIQRALLAGDVETGVCIMQMDAGLDTGAVWSRQALPIGPAETAGTLLARLTALGASMIVDTLTLLDRLSAPQPQPETGVTYAHKIDKREAAIDFMQPAVLIERQIRAFDPTPGAFCMLDGQLMKLWRAVARPDLSGVAEPGEVTRVDDTDGLTIACGEGTLCVQEVQRAGGRRQPAIEFARAHALTPGTRLAPGAAVTAVAPR
jgi:methionyl-tRNA formyltransferase